MSIPNGTTVETPHEGDRDERREHEFLDDGHVDGVLAGLPDLLEFDELLLEAGDVVDRRVEIGDATAGVLGSSARISASICRT